VGGVGPVGAGGGLDSVLVLVGVLDFIDAVVVAVLVEVRGVGVVAVLVGVVVDLEVGPVAGGREGPGPGDLPGGAGGDLVVLAIGVAVFELSPLRPGEAVEAVVGVEFVQFGGVLVPVVVGEDVLAIFSVIVCRIIEQDDLLSIMFSEVLFSRDCLDYTLVYALR